MSDGILDVPGALEHPVLRHNLAVPEPDVRAYLGIPLVTQSCRRMGALCTIDGTARTWAPDERAILENLAAAAGTDLQLRLSASANAHQASHDALTGLANRRQLDRDLDAALAEEVGPSQLALLDLDGSSPTTMRSATPPATSCCAASPAVCANTPTNASTTGSRAGRAAVRSPRPARGDRDPADRADRLPTDAYDAMTAERAYRPAMQPGEAKEELRRCSGTKFDPVTDAIEQALAERRHDAPSFFASSWGART